MDLNTLVTLYSEFEVECKLRNLTPNYSFFALWAEIHGKHTRFDPEEWREFKADLRPHAQLRSERR